MMTHHKVACFRAAALGFLSCSMTSVLLAQPTLRITSPADGTVVHPGETLTVTVAASPEGAFQEVMIIGEDRIGFSEALTTPPYEFRMPILPDILPGQYLLTADGVTSPGHSVQSKSIRIDVERPDPPVSLRVKPIDLRLDVGEETVLRVDGVFSDGTTTYLNHSTLLKLSSDAPSIATTARGALVTAVAPGSTKLVITYREIKVEVPVTVVRAERP